MAGHRCASAAAVALTCALCMASVDSLSAEASEHSVADLSLEELMNIQVVSGAKKLQRIADSAAAVFVITAEDIRRSGATSIPEALRMAPGVEVARFGSNKWAVSIRGFNGRFANKLLVLLDGRSLYTPLFAGVQWELQEVVLADIERIEVIRGPGAALWGANAVNGVINIITKHAKATQGGMVSAGAGSVERGFGTVRYGGKVADDGAYRIYAKGLARDRFPDATGAAGRDDHDAGHVGFRLDKPAAGGELVVHGNAYHAKSGDSLAFGTRLAPFVAVRDIDQVGKGFNLLARWESTRSGEGTSLQAFVEDVDFRFSGFTEKRRTLDLELQQRGSLGSSHDLLYGFGYRSSRDDIRSVDIFGIDPASRSTSLWSAFVQDEMTLVPKRVRLTLGARLERNSYTGKEFQPNARLLWTPSQHQSVWASAARAVRTPSRLESDGSVQTQVIPPFGGGNPGPLPAEISLVGSPRFDSERLDAFEIGYRHQFAVRAAFNASVFVHQYDQLRTFALGAPDIRFLAAPPYTFIPLNTGNAGSGRLRGIELSGEYRPTEDWRLSGFVARQWLDLDVGASPDAAVIRGSPQYTMSVRSTWNLGRSVELDVWLRHVSSLRSIGIPAYTNLDTRLGWKVSPTLDVALVGQNLLDRSRREYVSDFVGTSTYEVPRGAYVRLDWKF